MQRIARGVAWPGQARRLMPGLLASAVVAAAAGFLAEHYGAPVMLFALLLGLAMNFLAVAPGCQPGIEFASKHLLRCGVALLGLRITANQVVALGWQPVLCMVAAVVATIVVGVIAARAMGLRGLFGLLTGGAVAICGASAAGIFLGGMIHDVAQVVGAGYSLGTQAGDTATLVKLLRVAMLLPVIVFAAMLTRRVVGNGADGAEPGPRPPLLPGFALAFALLVVINSFGWLPRPALALGNDLSRAFLVAAIGAIGMKTQLKDLATVGWKPIALMVGETSFLAGLVWAMLKLGPMGG